MFYERLETLLNNIIQGHSSGDHAFRAFEFACADLGK